MDAPTLPDNPLTSQSLPIPSPPTDKPNANKRAYYPLPSAPSPSTLPLTSHSATPSLDTRGTPPT